MVVYRKGSRRLPSALFHGLEERMKVMRTAKVLLTFLLVSCVFAQDDPIARWEKAVGGREKVAAIKAIYREATLEYGDYHGTLKVWHTSDGKYRKEENIATFSTIETFDGSVGMVKQNSEPASKMNEMELRMNLSRRFANSNSMFFVFFPERHHGKITVADDGSIVFVPEGGIDWHVTLDPATGLPKTMTHTEGARSVVVSFESYETFDGLKLEKEIHRTAGEGPVAVIKFTKTVINPPVESSLFAQNE